MGSEKQSEKGAALVPEIPYRVLRSKRKSVSLEITDDLEVLVRAPRKFPEKEIAKLVEKYADWIARARARKQAKGEKYPPVSVDEEAALRRTATQVLPGKVAYYAEKMGVTPTGLRVTGAKKRFGSCSAKNSLCFSFYLMRYPEIAIDYVVVHELAHIRHHDHSRAFYDTVAQVLPDYKAREKLLKS